MNKKRWSYLIVAALAAIVLWLLLRRSPAAQNIIRQIAQGVNLPKIGSLIWPDFGGSPNTYNFGTFNGFGGDAPPRNSIASIPTPPDMKGDDKLATCSLCYSEGQGFAPAGNPVGYGSIGEALGSQFATTAPSMNNYVMMYSNVADNVAGALFW